MTRKYKRKYTPRKYHKKRGPKKILQGYHLVRRTYGLEKMFILLYGIISLLSFFAAFTIESSGANTFLLSIGFFFFLVTLLFFFRWEKAHTFLHQYQTISKLRSIDPLEFEHYCANLLKLMGHTKVKVTPSTSDFGTDIISTYHNLKYTTQCKRYAANHKATSPELQTFLGSMHHHDGDRGIFITTSTFTQDAQVIAKKNGIELIDDVELSSLIAKYFAANE